VLTPDDDARLRRRDAVVLRLAIERRTRAGGTPAAVAGAGSANVPCTDVTGPAFRPKS